MAQLAFSEDLNSILQINTCKANSQLRNKFKIFSQFSKKNLHSIPKIIMIFFVFSLNVTPWHNNQFQKISILSHKLRLQRLTIISKYFLSLPRKFALSGRWQNTTIFVLPLTATPWHNMHFQTEGLSSIPQIDTTKA